MKKDGRSLSHEVLETFRRSAVRLRSKGVAIKIIAESFGVRREAVSRWISAARKYGINKLIAKKAPGPIPRLKQEHFKELLRILKKPASKVGYSTDLWSGNRVRHLLKKQWKINYHSKHMCRFLRRIGLVLKFPERRALEQDPVELRKWKIERFPEILRYAKRHNSLVFYADECLISLIPYVGRTWTFPTIKPIVRVSGKRGQHIGITGAVNANGRFCFELTKEEERFTAKVFLRFVQKLHLEYRRRNILLIVDGARTHIANIVKNYEKQNASWFRLEILPAYSPELNPSEECWNFIKTKRMNGSMAMDKKELRKESVRAARSLKKNTDMVRSFF